LITRAQTAAYIAVIAGCFGFSMAIGWLPPAERANNIFYDAMLARQPEEKWTPQSVVVAIDEQTLSRPGMGMRNIRSILAEAIKEINAASPAVVASDITLSDETDDVAGNQALEAALRATKNLVLPCDIVTVNGLAKWEDPLPRFVSAEPGHVHRDDGEDDANRQVPLEEIADGKRRWALALQAFSLAHGEPLPTETPDDVETGGVTIPARRANRRLMYIRYLPAGVPTVSAIEIASHRDLLRGKTVFVGVTALAANDQAQIPFGGTIPGVALHSQIYETIARGRFFTPARNDLQVLLCALFAAAAGLIFAVRSGWSAYALAAVVLALAVWTPVQFFHHDIVFPFFEPVAVAWVTVGGAASFQYFFVQRQLRRSESEKSRYQQAIHWAAHEMRTPLTAIQGSSEIMTRYALTDAKRQQLTEMINSESKRLARMIQTFLDVERLADGQMELKREPFSIAQVVETCFQRATPIAERKNIGLFLDEIADATLIGDRELMEYALYNLLTNAIKYSPADTQIHVLSELDGGRLRVAVRDQGIGMDAKELKSIFKKFYRTKRAEASGEAGTGIGLSIVEQIVTHHGGRMEVTSEPGKGSCFTMIIAVHVSAAAAPSSGAREDDSHAETSDRRR
jgi:signal transduction histidine kinase